MFKKTNAQANNSVTIYAETKPIGSFLIFPGSQFKEGDLAERIYVENR